jgi:hypothetical protein
MPTARTPEDEDQIRRDRKALLRGALATGAGLAGAVVLLRKAKGGVAGQAPYVPPPLKVKPLRKGEKVEVNALKRGGNPGGAIDRQIKAAGLRQNRAYDALRPVSTKKLAKLTPETREKFNGLAKNTRGSITPPAAAVKAGQLSPGELDIRPGNRAVREKKRQARGDLARFRRTKGFEASGEPRELADRRDSGDTARDVAVAGGAVASGGAAVHAAREWARTNRTAQGAVKQIVPKLDPKEIVREGVNQIGSKAKGKVKEYFPTFTKAGKAVGRVLKKKVFATPASGLFHFGGVDQLIEPGSEVYADPLKVASGLQRAYKRGDSTKTPVDLPIGHAQTIKAAYRKADKVNRVATRGGRLAKDVVNTVRGQPRDRDAAGRKKKREWEKSWFREGVKKAATAGVVLGGATYLRKNPVARGKLVKGAQRARNWVNSKVPDLVPRGFVTPASGFFEFARKSVDPKEEENVLRAARVRNGLVGAAAGSFLGGALHGGKSGYQGARVGAALGGLYGVASNPRRRAAIEDLQVAAFTTPAGALFEFDEVAADAGWDVRDPRGKSARVFAPGSRQRQRREKQWHEEVSNERKLWKVGMLTAAVAAGAGGAAIGRRFPRKPKVPVAAPDVKDVVRGPWAKSG